MDALRIQVLTSFGRLYRVQGRYDEAEPLYRRALALAEEKSSDASQLGRVLNHLALLCKDTARLGEAARIYARVAAITKRALGADHPQVAGAYFNLGALEHARCRYAAAEPLARRAMKIHEKLLGPEHADVAADVALLAAILTGRKKYAAAEPLYQRAVTLMVRVYGRTHQEVAGVLNNLAALYQAQGDGTKPERLCKRVLAIKEKLLGPDHPDLATTLNNLAVLYRGLGLFAEARPLYQRALRILEKSVGSAHPTVARTLENHAHLLQAEAEAMEKRAKRIERDLKTTSNSARARPAVDQNFAHFRLVVRPSRIHRWGIFAEETIPAGKEVIEYTGERISLREAKRRSRRQLVYLFQLDRYWKIDGAVKGSGAQYVNHCCDPNVVVRKIDGHILYFSKRRIQAGEELLLDYKFRKAPARALNVPCNCGAANCRGTINRK